MSRLIDLTGQKFGLLTVQKYVGNKKWECRCDCGNIKIIEGGELRRKTRTGTRSCGCLVGTGLIGKKYGQLLVKSKIKDTDRYICVCLICGKETKRAYMSLIQGDTQKCEECANKNRSEVMKKYFIEGTYVNSIRLNKKPGEANTSGVVGVYWDKLRQKWTAEIVFKKKKYYLGRYTRKKEAIQARKQAEKEIFGDFLKWYEEFKKTRKGVKQ